MLTVSKAADYKLSLQDFAVSVLKLQIFGINFGHHPLSGRDKEICLFSKMPWQSVGTT